MKMAKASQADLDMAMDVCSALDGISGHWPWMPGSEGDERFDADDPAHCTRVIAHLIETMQRGSLSRVVWGCVTMLDPRNGLVDQDADTIEHNPKAAKDAARWRYVAPQYSDALIAKIDAAIKAQGASNAARTD